MTKMTSSYLFDLMAALTLWTVFYRYYFYNICKLLYIYLCWLFTIVTSMFRYLIYCYCCYQIVVYTTNSCLHQYSRIEFYLICFVCSSFSLLYFPVGSSKSNAGTISRQERGEGGVN